MRAQSASCHGYTRTRRICQRMSFRRDEESSDKNIHVVRFILCCYPMSPVLPVMGSNSELTRYSALAPSFSSRGRALVTCTICLALAGQEHAHPRVQNSSWADPWLAALEAAQW